MRLNMADVLTPKQRSHNMSRIRSRNTRPEIVIRKGLHAAGLRFRLHRKDLPGKPDLVFPKHLAAIQVHGCFWHGHDCTMFKWPITRADFWKDKISRNRERDRVSLLALQNEGWRVLVVWECALRGVAKWPIGDLIGYCEKFVREGSETISHVSGKEFPTLEL